MMRPDYVPVFLIAAGFFAADLLFMRPLGLWAGLVVLGWCAMILYLLSGWIFALPLLLLGNQRPGQAIAGSVEACSGHRWDVLRAVLAWLLCEKIVSGKPTAVGAATGAVASLMVLVLLTPLPIAITGFCYGWAGAAIASLVAGAILTVIGTINAGLFHLILFGIPTTAAIYYALLSRDYTDETGATHHEWYPIGRVLFGIAIAIYAIAQNEDVRKIASAVRSSKPTCLGEA